MRIQAYLFMFWASGLPQSAALQTKLLLQSAELATETQLPINEQLCSVNLPFNSFRFNLRQNSNISGTLLHTQPTQDAAVTEEKELITVANAPICEMGFSYQTQSKSWPTETREGWQRLTQRILLHFSVWWDKNILPSHPQPCRLEAGKVRED